MASRGARPHVLDGLAQVGVLLAEGARLLCQLALEALHTHALPRKHKARSAGARQPLGERGIGPPDASSPPLEAQCGDRAFVRVAARCERHLRRARVLHGAVLALERSVDLDQLRVRARGGGELRRNVRRPGRLALELRRQRGLLPAESDENAGGSQRGAPHERRWQSARSCCCDALRSASRAEAASSTSSWLFCCSAASSALTRPASSSSAACVERSVLSRSPAAVSSALRSANCARRHARQGTARRWSVGWSRHGRASAAMGCAHRPGAVGWGPATRLALGVVGALALRLRILERDGLELNQLAVLGALRLHLATPLVRALPRRAEVVPQLLRLAFGRCERVVLRAEAAVELLLHLHQRGCERAAAPQLLGEPRLQLGDQIVQLHHLRLGLVEVQLAAGARLDLEERHGGVEVAEALVD
eukprot:4556628-Prymnesium_polylepis.1